MDSECLPVAAIGVGGFGQHCLQAISKSTVVRLVGVADKDSEAATRAGQEYRVPSFNDNRSLLAQTKPRAVYLAVPPTAAGDVIKLCAERGIHIWKETPLARNLDEAAAFVRRAEGAGLKLAVGTQRRFAASYRRAWELRERLGQVFLARAHYLFNWGRDLGWRGDRVSAGGGALMELGYHPIDLLVWIMGLPDTVYGLSTSGKRHSKPRPDDKLGPLYDTDDTAAAIFRYNSGLMAAVVTTRSSGPVSEELSLHGRDGSLRADGETCLFRDPDGNVQDRVCEEMSPQAVFRRQVEAFAQAVLSDAQYYECSARENLLDLAVIEAIYLSDRTAQPESPLGRLKTHGFSLQDCLVRRQPSPQDKPKVKPSTRGRRVRTA